MRLDTLDEVNQAILKMKQDFPGVDFDELVTHLTAEDKLDAMPLD